MLTDLIPIEHIRRSGYFEFGLALLTTLGLTLFHYHQEDLFLIDLIAPPSLSVLLAAGLIVLVLRPDSVRTILPASIFLLGVALWLPAWYFTVVAWQDPQLHFIDIFPPITSFALPLAAGSLLFIKLRIAVIFNIIQWLVFSLPIFWYLAWHPLELFDPRGIEILVILGPSAFLLHVLMIFSQGLQVRMTGLRQDRHEYKRLSETDSLTGLYN